MGKGSTDVPRRPHVIVVDGREPMDWVDMRNRPAHIDARNKRDILRLLEVSGERIGFRLARTSQTHHGLRRVQAVAPPGAGRKA